MGAACSFSEHAVTIVASISTVTRAPPAPGAASPARSQARCRASARAARMAFSARGASAAKWAISRETTGSEATGPDSPRLVMPSLVSWSDRCRRPRHGLYPLLDRRGGGL